jgi:hypothetical protein
MGVRAGADDHRIDLVICQQGLIVRDSLGDIQLSGTLFGRVDNNVRDRHEAGVGNAVREIRGVEPADASGPYEPYPDHFSLCHRILPGPGL